MLYFEDIIERLLQKKAEVKAKREELDVAEAKIDNLLREAGYVEPTDEENTAAEPVLVEEPAEPQIMYNAISSY